MNTGQKVLDAIKALPHCKPKWNGQRSEWQFNDPLNSGSDSRSMWLKIEPDGEHGMYCYFAHGDGGSLYELAEKLGIELPARSNGHSAVTAPDLTAVPEDIPHEAYARRKGVPVSVFTDAGWQIGSHDNRPCWLIPHSDNIIRAHFVDAQSPKAKPTEAGAKRVWYSAPKRATDIAGEGKPIVLCNGQSSTVIAQHFGIPAFCQTGGEAAIDDSLLPGLRQQITGRVLWIMLDCDEAGRKAAQKIADQMRDLLVVVIDFDVERSDGYDLADFCAKHRFASYVELERLAESQAPAPERISTDITLRRFRMRMEETYIIPGEPLIIPFKSFHELGGFAKVIMPGKVIGVVAPSSQGKTSFLETWADMWMQSGLDGLWYGPEWTEDEYQARRIQRLGGASYEEMAMWDIDRSERARQVPADQKVGVLLAQDICVRTFKIIDILEKWPGQMHYFAPRSILEDTLEIMARHLHTLRKSGRRVGFAIFDYLQLLRIGDKEHETGNRYEAALELVKYWCQINHIVALCGSQVRKIESREAKIENKLIDSDGALYIRDDKCNLFISLNIQYVKNDLTGTVQRTNYGIANVTKNSVGQLGLRKIIADFPHLCWRDLRWTQAELEALKYDKRIEEQESRYGRDN